MTAFEKGNLRAATEIPVASNRIVQKLKRSNEVATLSMNAPRLKASGFWRLNSSGFLMNMTTSPRQHNRNDRLREGELARRYRDSGGQQQDRPKTEEVERSRQAVKELAGVRRRLHERAEVKGQRVLEVEFI